MHCKYLLLYFLTRFVRVVCREHSHAHDEAQPQEHGAQTKDVRYTLVFLHPGHYALCWSRHGDAEDAGITEMR